MGQAEENSTDTRETSASHWFDPRCLGLAFVLAVIPFFTRMTNPYLMLFENALITRAFLGAVFFTALVLAAIAFVVSFIRPLSFRGTPVILTGSVLTIMGLLIPLFDLSKPLTVIAGILIGAGIVLLLGAWARRYATLKPPTILLHTALSFLLMSILFALAHIASDATVLCLILCAYLVCACVIYAIGTSHIGDPAVPSSPPASASHGDAIGFLWVPYLGAAYSFLVSGMTLVPSVAGLEFSGSEPTFPRVIAYLMVAVVIVLLFMGRDRRASSEDIRLLYKTVLPIAAAVLMVFPFIDLDMGGFLNSLIGIIGFTGFCLFYTLAWAATAMARAVCDYPESRAFSLLTFVSAAGFLLGGQMIPQVGTNGRIVSLVMLAAFLTAMSISAIVSSAHGNQAPSAPTAIGGESVTLSATERMDIRCAQIARDNGLTAREAEILHYLAQGRGAVRIADELCISPDTVRTHIKRIYDKVGIHRREDLLDLLNRDDPTA